MANATGPSIYQKFDITSRDGSKTVSLSGGIIEFQYFEDLFSPVITAKVKIVDTGNTIDGQGVFNGLPIRGGEKVEFTIQTPVETIQRKKLTFQNFVMYVNSVKNLLADRQSETFELNLISGEALINEQVRVPIVLKNQTIDQSATKILQYLGRVRVNVIEPTENSYNFFGNLRKPFTLLTMLAARSIPVGSKSKSAGYFFWQTWKGFNFLSPDGIIKEAVKNKNNLQIYQYKQILETSYKNELQNFTKILTYSVVNDGDIIGDLQKGEYSSHRMYYDASSFQFVASRFSEESPNRLGGKEAKPEYLDPNNIPGNFLGSRNIVGILDVGTHGGSENDVNTHLNDFPGNHTAQAITRYSSLFTQQMTLTVPVNPMLTAGDAIRLQFPKVTDEGGAFDDELSGLYIIKELTHLLLPQQSYTAMRVLRDTHGSKGQKNNG